MALIKCSECGHDVSDLVSTCPHCGKPIKKDDNNEFAQAVCYHHEVRQNNSINTKGILGIVFTSLALIFSFVSFFFYGFLSFFGIGFGIPGIVCSAKCNRKGIKIPFLILSISATVLGFIFVIFWILAVTLYINVLF